MIRRPPRSTLFPYTTLSDLLAFWIVCAPIAALIGFPTALLDRKSTRLNSSHTIISYAVFCLKKKKEKEAAGANRGEERGTPGAETRLGARQPTSRPPRRRAPLGPVPERSILLFVFFNDTATTEIYTLSLHDALPIWAMKITLWISILSNLAVLGVFKYIGLDRKSTRLNSSHTIISYAVFCLKKK